MSAEKNLQQSGLLIISEMAVQKSADRIDSDFKGKQIRERNEKVSS